MSVYLNPRNHLSLLGIPSLKQLRAALPQGEEESYGGHTMRKRESSRTTGGILMAIEIRLPVDAPTFENRWEAPIVEDAFLLDGAILSGRTHDLMAWHQWSCVLESVMHRASKEFATRLLLWQTNHGRKEALEGATTFIASSSSFNLLALLWSVSYGMLTSGADAVDGDDTPLRGGRVHLQVFSRLLGWAVGGKIAKAILTSLISSPKERKGLIACIAGLEGVQPLVLDDYALYDTKPDNEEDNEEDDDGEE